MQLCPTSHRNTNTEKTDSMQEIQMSFYVKLPLSGWVHLVWHEPGISLNILYVIFHFTGDEKSMSQIIHIGELRKTKFNLQTRIKYVLLE